MNASHPHQRKLGRNPRSYNPRIPHLSALRAGRQVPPPPPSVDYTTGMPANFGMMLNDTLGDCTCAAFYHAIQVWSFKAQSKETTEPDRDVEQLYIQACGYDPKQGGEGPGGNEQHVLTYLLNSGAPFGPAGKSRHKILGFVEVDPRNIDDVKSAINTKAGGSGRRAAVDHGCAGLHGPERGWPAQDACVQVSDRCAPRCGRDHDDRAAGPWPRGHRQPVLAIWSDRRDLPSMFAKLVSGLVGLRAGTRVHRRPDPRLRAAHRAQRP